MRLKTFLRIKIWRELTLYSKKVCRYSIKQKEW